MAQTFYGYLYYLCLKNVLNYYSLVQFTSFYQNNSLNINAVQEILGP